MIKLIYTYREDNIYICKYIIMFIRIAMYVLVLSNAIFIFSNVYVGKYIYCE